MLKNRYLHAFVFSTYLQIFEQRKLNSIVLQNFYHYVSKYLNPNAIRHWVDQAHRINMSADIFQLSNNLLGIR